MLTISFLVPKAHNHHFINHTIVCLPHISLFVTSNGLCCSLFLHQRRISWSTMAVHLYWTSISFCEETLMGNNKMDDLHCVVICVDTHIRKSKSPSLHSVWKGGRVVVDLHLHPPSRYLSMKRYFFSLFQKCFVLYGSCSICVFDKQTHTHAHTLYVFCIISFSTCARTCHCIKSCFILFS